MSDRADQAIAVARDSLQSLAKQRVGFTRAVNIGGQESANSLFVSEANQREETLVLDRFAEVHETPAAPHPKRGLC